MSSVPRIVPTREQGLNKLLLNQRMNMPVPSQVLNEAIPGLSLAFFKSSLYGHYRAKVKCSHAF